MGDQYIKKFWDEEDILYYLHFQDKWAVRQIEISSAGNKFLSQDNPNEYLDMCDQPIDHLDLTDMDFITAEEFNKVWLSKK